MPLPNLYFSFPYFSISAFYSFFLHLLPFLWLKGPNNQFSTSFLFNKKYVFLLVCIFMYGRDTEGRVWLPNRMNFRKKSKRPWPPPPSFSENYIAIFFIMDMVAYMQRSDSMKCLLKSVSCFYFSQYNCWKTYPEPWIYSFCTNFMLKKPCLKFPKSAI